MTILSSLGVWKLLSVKIAKAMTLKDEELDKKLFKMIADDHRRKADELPPEKTRGIDIDFKDGVRYVTLLIFGQWIHVGTGVRLQGLYEIKDRKTVYLITVENCWRLAPHKHLEAEHVEILHGRMLDCDTGQIYEKGGMTSWEIPAGEYHSVEFQSTDGEPCLVKVTTIPSLKTLEETPLMLDEMEHLVGLG